VVGWLRSAYLAPAPSAMAMAIAAATSVGFGRCNGVCTCVDIPFSLSYR